MKNFFSVVFFAFSLFSGFAQGYRDYSDPEAYSSLVPEILQGVWQGSDRLLLFNGEDAAFACVLRVFYRWYDDRAAESEQYAQVSSRDRNNTTSSHPENITIDFKTLYENTSKTAGAYELRVRYPSSKEYSYIPLAVVNGSVYLNFFLKEDSLVQTESPSQTFFLSDYSAASGITISPPVIKKELLSYLVDGSDSYPVRYWLSDVEFTDRAEFLEQTAQLSDGEKTYTVPKYLQTAGRLYTCTTGRRSEIRNVHKNTALPYDFITDDEHKIYAYSTPYLVYVPGTGNFEQLNSAVKETNSKRHPPQTPVFPAKEPHYRWKEITDIELYNPKTWNIRNLDIHK